MVWKKRINPKKAAIPTYIVAVVAAAVMFLLIGGDGFQGEERDVLAGILVAIASFVLAFGVILWRGMADYQSEMTQTLLLVTGVGGFVFMLIVGLVSPAVADLPEHEFAPLAVYWLAVTVIELAVSLILFVSLFEAIGESGIERMKLGLKQSLKIWNQYKKSKSGMFALTVLVIIFVIAIIGPAIALENPALVKEGGGGLPTPPDSKYWLGTDAQNKDILSQMFYGAGTSLLVGFLAGAISIVLGTAIGLVAGYYGRAADELLMRMTDFFLVIPWFPLMIVLVAILGKSLWIVIIVIGIVSWSPTARVVRAQVLSIKEKQFIERSKALGGGNMHIIRKHIMPNVFPLIVATSILLVAEAIFSEAFLDFFGLGDPNTISWGWMLERAHANGAMLNFWWWWIAPPGVAIVLLIMSFYLCGDTLDEILNPRLKHR